MEKDERICDQERRDTEEMMAENETTTTLQMKRNTLYCKLLKALDVIESEDLINLLEIERELTLREEDPR